MIKSLSKGKNNKSLSNMATMKRKKLIFYVCASILPIIQFIIFYFIVNFSSFTLAFRQYDKWMNNGRGGWIWTLTGNFSDVVDVFKNPYMVGAIFRGIGIYVVQQLTFFISIFFSYYITKRYLGAKAFQLILFLPSIISGMVMMVMYKNFVTEALPEVVRMLSGKTITGLLDTTNYSQTFVVIWFYTSVGQKLYRSNKAND